MKRILIIGAGFLQSFVIRKAKELGYYVIAVDKNPESVGFKYADEFEIIDIIDQQSCLMYAIKKNIDGVMTAATDYGVLTASYIAQEMDLPGLDYNIAKLVKNKYLVRRTLFDNMIDDVSQYYEIDSLSSLEKVKKSITFPVIVKPCDGSGSKAITRVDSEAELESAIKHAISASLVGKALIEEFIEGLEYGVESIVYNGEVYVLGVMGKQMTPAPYYAELGHYFPSQLDICVEKRVKEVVQKAIKSLGINFGAVNMDVLVTSDDRVCIIDVGARMGGNLIGSHIIPYGTGIDYLEILIRSAVGDPFEMVAKNKSRNIVTKILALKPGIIMALPDFEKIKEKYQVNIYHHLEVGRQIRPYRNNLDGCGYVLSISDNLQQAFKLTEAAKNQIDKEIMRL